MTPLEGGLIIGSYLLGSIPFSVLIAKGFYGIDIRQHGSRNAGATNVWRVLGARPGLSTLALDLVKGVGAVLAARGVAPEKPWIMVLCGLAAIIGHNWSVFLKGKGGKGVATSAGVFLALIPVPAIISLVAFLIFFLATRHVSVGSMAGALALLAATLALPVDNLFRFFVAVASVMLLIKHVPNMKRLLKGEEPKVKLR